MPKPRTILEKLATVHDDEVGPVLLAALSFFLVLCGYSMLRPIREAMGVEREMSELRALFVATMIVTVVANFAIGVVVARAARRVLVPIVYRTISVCLVGFVAVLWVSPDRIGSGTGAVFYVWLSVANLFLISLFWVTMTDCLTLEQAKRLFPIVAVGGTLGALSGAAINRALVESIGVEWMFVLALFANIDILTQGGTLIIQLFLAGRLIKWLGVGFSLAVLPVVLVGGFAVLAAAPVYAAAALFAASFRVGKYAVMRPARETLFTVVSDNERLAAKPFIDTFVYRFGDVLGTALTPVLLVAAPVAVGWAGVGLWLGRRQSRIAGDSDCDPLARAWG